MSEPVADHVAEGVRLLQLGDEALRRAERVPAMPERRSQHAAEAERYYRAATAHLQAALALDAVRPPTVIHINGTVSNEDLDRIKRTFDHNDLP